MVPMARYTHAATNTCFSGLPSCPRNAQYPGFSACLPHGNPAALPGLSESALCHEAGSCAKEAFCLPIARHEMPLCPEAECCPSFDVASHHDHQHHHEQAHLRRLAEEEEENFMVAFLQAEGIPLYPFPLPVDDEDPPDELTLLEKWDMVRKCQNLKSNEGGCCGIYVSTDGKVDHPLAEELRQKLLSEYADTVFRSEIFADPPREFLAGFTPLG